MHWVISGLGKGDIQCVSGAGCYVSGDIILIVKVLRFTKEILSNNMCGITTIETDPSVHDLVVPLPYYTSFASCSREQELFCKMMRINIYQIYIYTFYIHWLTMSL